MTETETDPPLIAINLDDLNIDYFDREFFTALADLHGGKKGEDGGTRFRMNGNDFYAARSAFFMGVIATAQLFSDLGTEGGFAAVHRTSETYTERTDRIAEGFFGPKTTENP